MRRLGVVAGLGVGLSFVLVVSALASASAGPSPASHGNPPGPTYNATFTETGLPSGTSWSVHVAFIGCGCEGVRKTFTATTPTITVALANGSYRYNVLRVPGYYVNVSAHGTFNVSGAAPAPLGVVFHTFVPYPAVFSETGLPNGTVWSVTVAGNGHGQESSLEHVTSSSNTSNVTFSLPNGTYRYTVGPVSGSFLNGTGKGKFVIDGAAPAPIAVAFVTPPLYNVTFSETGLVAGTNWSVRLGGVGAEVHIHGTHSSNGATVSFALPNGTYHFAVGEVLGYDLTAGSSGEVNVTGAAVSVPVTYQPLAAGAFFAVTFAETGLAAGTHWVVTVLATHTFGHTRSATDSSNTTGMSFYLQNGTYRYRLHEVHGYTISDELGTFAVNGSAVGPITVTYGAIATFTATFNETGLANGTVWELIVRSQSPGSTPWHIRVETTTNNSSFTLALPDGAYCYRLFGVPGYHLTAGKAEGSFTIDNAAVPTLTFGFTARG